MSFFDHFRAVRRWAAGFARIERCSGAAPTSGALQESPVVRVGVLHGAGPAWRSSLAAAVLLAGIIAGSVGTALATVDDALSFAYEAAAPYVKQGFSVREDAWGGDLGVKDQKAVTAQLFRGNEYWFWLGSDVRGAVVTVSVYDSNGKLAQTEAWQRGRLAGARVIPTATGTYYAIVTIQKSPVERTPWALVYGYR